MHDDTSITVPPSIYNAYHICRREAWLMFRQLNADQQNSYLERGRFIDESTYTREKKKIYLADISAMVDMVTKKDGEYFIAEIKKSSKRLDNALIQLKYYLYLFRKKNITAKGMLKIPREKKNIEVELTDDEFSTIDKNIPQIFAILYKEMPPEKCSKKVCNKCAHFEFCWS